MDTVIRDKRHEIGLRDSQIDSNLPRWPPPGKGNPKMKLQTIAAIAVLGSAVSGCATIVNGTKQSVSVSTTPVQGAECTLTNSEGTWYLTSPASVEVHKTKNDLTVTCKKDGYQPGSQVSVSNFGGATFGNIVAGGVIGAGVDAASGANYYYNTPMIVPLGETVKPVGATPSPSAAAPSP